MAGDYKSSDSAKAAARLKLRRDAIKAAGGEEYAALLAKERAQRQKWRTANPDKVRERERIDRRRGYPFRTWLCSHARARGRKRGLEATITPADLEWPTHCPVLGIELDYPERNGMRGKDPVQPNWPSLDRFDPAKGYVPGNVFVISYRANTLKNNGTLDEFLAVVGYLKNGAALAMRCGE